MDKAWRWSLHVRVPNCDALSVPGLEEMRATGKEGAFVTLVNQLTTTKQFQHSNR